MIEKPHNCVNCHLEVRGSDRKLCKPCLEQDLYMVYCGRACQQEHWRLHKQVCGDPRFFSADASRDVD